MADTTPNPPPTKIVRLVSHDGKIFEVEEPIAKRLLRHCLTVGKERAAPAAAAGEADESYEDEEFIQLADDMADLVLNDMLGTGKHVKINAKGELLKIVVAYCNQHFSSSTAVNADMTVVNEWKLFLNETSQFMRAATHLMEFLTEFTTVVTNKASKYDFAALAAAVREKELEDWDKEFVKNLNVELCDDLWLLADDLELRGLTKLLSETQQVELEEGDA